MKILAFLTNSSGGISIPAVANYNALIAAYPPPNTAYLGQYVFCENSQGTWWAPGPILGTYYPAGVYYCNGIDWKYTNVPYQATQTEVDAGTATDVFVSPATFNNASKWSNYAPVAQGLPSGGTAGQLLAKIDATNYNTEWIDNFTPTVKHLVKAGEALTKGQAVYISTADGTNMIAMKASNTSEATSAQTMGIIAQDLSLNQTGYVITEGLLAGTGPAPLNTNSGNAGDPIYLGVNGTLIFGVANKPVAPAHLVYLGVITRKQNVNGEIFVKVQNGYELEELHNVDAVNPSNNDGLFYNTTTSLWEHKSITTALGYTPYNSTNPSGYITSSALSPYLTSATAASTYQTILPAASALANGYLTSTDWSTFNNKLSGIKFVSGASSSLTGTLSETILITFTVPANSFSATDALEFAALFQKTLSLSQLQFKLRIGTANTIAGSTVIATTTSTTLANIYGGIRRSMFSIQGGNLTGYNFGTSSVDDAVIATVAFSSTPYDVTQTYYWMLTVTLTNIGDTVKIQSAKLNNT